MEIIRISFRFIYIIVLENKFVIFKFYLFYSYCGLRTSRTINTTIDFTLKKKSKKREDILTFNRNSNSERKTFYPQKDANRNQCYRNTIQPKFKSSSEWTHSSLSLPYPLHFIHVCFSIQRLRYIAYLPLKFFTRDI